MGVRPCAQVGARMSAAALNLVYGKDVPYLNPAYTNATQQTLGNSLVVTVTFALDSVYDGLHLAQGVVCPTGLGVPASECSWYDVQTVDGTWWNATQVMCAPLVISPASATPLLVGCGSARPCTKSAQCSPPLGVLVALLSTCRPFPQTACPWCSRCLARPCLPTPPGATSPRTPW